MLQRKVVVAITIAASLVCVLAVGADAQRRRRRQPQQAARQAEAPQSAAIADALGDLRWGTEPREVHAHFVNKIRERYRERIAKAPGTIEEDRIRREMDDEIRRMRESYTRFEGVRSGWDSSFLRGEFTHGNRESMLVYRDENSQNFYFFIGARLWKWYKAFDASVFAGQSFDQFAGAVQGRFGRAVERTGVLAEGGPEQRWLEWQDATTRLRAVDHTRFYGFYCLVFEDKATLSRLPQLRTNTQQLGQGGHALVDSVILPEGQREDASDQNADIADRLTGSIRRQPTPQAGQPQPAPQPQQAGGSAQPAPTPAPSRGGGSLSLDDL